MLLIIRNSHGILLFSFPTPTQVIRRPMWHLVSFACCVCLLLPRPLALCLSHSSNWLGLPLPLSAAVPTSPCISNWSARPSRDATARPICLPMCGLTLKANQLVIGFVWAFITACSGRLSQPVRCPSLHSVNVTKGPPEDRQLTTGRHTVRDIFCLDCEQLVGWFYVGCPDVMVPGVCQSFQSHRWLISWWNLPPQSNPQDAAVEESQKYKVGKFILEKSRILKQELL